MDESTPTVTSGDCWFTGPARRRRDYKVADPERLFGGQGLVFVAELTRVTPPIVVSLKQLTSISDSRAAELLERDEVLRCLEHPKLARHIETFQGPGLFQAGEIDEADLPSDLVYVAAEWVPGTPLGELPRSPTVAEAIRIIADVTSAVAYLHENGLTHRDLHPGNIVVSDAGPAVVIDLGYTRPAAEHATTLMRGGAGFIPPERDRDPSVATIECDLFQIGALAVYLLLGDPQTRTPLTDIAAKLEARLDGHVANPGDSGRAIVAMLSTDPQERPHDLGAWAADLSTSPPETITAPPAPAPHARRHFRVQAAAAVLVIGGLAAIGVLLLARSRSAPTPAPASNRCQFHGGEAGPGFDGASRSYLPAVATAVILRGSCASGPAYRYGSMVVQELGTPRRPDGAVISRSPGTTMYLTQAQWGSYRQIGGKDGKEAPIAAGPPLAVSTSPGLSEITLTHGLLVGSAPDEAHFWIPEPEVPIWQREGGAAGHLGLPTSNPYPRAGNLEQDYQVGYMSLASGSISIQVTVVADRAAGLPATSNLIGKLIRQSDGTAWFVDATATRHWIPDGTVWICHGGDPNLAVTDLTGYAVASLSAGPPAQC